LNPWNTGQQWPTNTAIAAAGTVHHGASTSGATWIAANVATNPLTPSPSSVRQRRGLVAGAQHVGRARVARAVLVRVGKAERLADDDGERDRADQVRGGDDGERGEHVAKIVVEKAPMP
jgi:hypothetical protein